MRSNMQDAARRRFLQLLGAGSVMGLAGCSGSDDGDTPNDDTTTDTPTPTETPSTGTGPTDGNPAGRAWTMYQADAANTGAIEAAPAEAGETVWSSTLEGSIDSGPVIVDGHVLWPTSDGAVHDLDRATGEKEMFYQSDDVFTTTPAVDEETVYVAGKNVHAINLSDSTLQWRTERGLPTENIPPRADPVVDGNDLYYIDSDAGRVIALDARDGAEQWSFDAGAGIPYSPAVADDTLILGNEAGDVYAVAREEGEELWQQELSDNVYGAPVAGADTVFITAGGSSGGDLYALNVDDGSVLWEYEATRLRTGVALTDGTIYTAGAGGRLRAVDAEDGEEQWQVPQSETGAAVRQVTPAIAGETLYVAAVDRILSVDTGGGDVQWTYNTADYRPVETMAVAEGNVLMGDDRQNVYVLE